MLLSCGHNAAELPALETLQELEKLANSAKVNPALKETQYFSASSFVLVVRMA